ncbi:MAG: sodium:proton antiporter [Chloroflexi bacterium]|nr:sodium:proton antiporter [Chloroflexota bacterium]
MLVSAVLVLGLGVLVCHLFARWHIPGLLGLIVLGIALGDAGLGILAPAFLALSGDIGALALILILLRAGIGLDRSGLHGLGRATWLLGTWPLALEALLLLAGTRIAFRLPAAEAAMAALIVASAAPAIIIPAMLSLQARGVGAHHHVPSIVLAATSIENVLAVTLFGALAAAVSGTGEGALHLAALLQVPLRLAAGALLGLAGGYGLALLLRRGPLQRPVERLCLVLCTTIGIALGGERLGAAGYAAVVLSGMLIRERAPEDTAAISRHLEGLWYIVQIVLFVTIGAKADLATIGQVGMPGLALIAVGLAGRALGAGLALQRTALSSKERAYASLALSPKATVQAAIGGVPLAMGLPSGDMILALSILAIVVTGPLGACAIDLLAPRWLATRSDGAPSPATIRLSSRRAEHRPG